MSIKYPLWCFLYIYHPIAAPIKKVPKSPKNQGFWGFKKFYGFLLTFSPAAADTIITHLKNTATAPNDYDMILTGDLGFIGSTLLNEMCVSDYNINISSVHEDCGKLIFDREGQDVHAGGSGCGCSASVLASYIMRKMKMGEIKRLLFVATGALLSPTTTNQNMTIPCIAHAVEFQAQ